MIYEGIWFNDVFYKGKTEKEFIKHEKHHFADDPKGEEKLKEVFSLINPKKVSKDEEAAG
jgi:hypothetical protein